MSKVKTFFAKYWWVPIAAVVAVLSAILLFRKKPLAELPIKIAKNADRIDEKKAKIDLERREKCAELEIEYQETIKRLDEKAAKKVERYKRNPDKLARTLERLARQ